MCSLEVIYTYFVIIPADYKGVRFFFFQFKTHLLFGKAAFNQSKMRLFKDKSRQRSTASSDLVRVQMCSASTDGQGI